MERPRQPQEMRFSLENRSDTYSDRFRQSGLAAFLPLVYCHVNRQR